ncbi:replication-relaxation family protein, partial [Streptomyces sp. SID3343]|uniref:replication-relaxation family protein n=1 Tax=Streptomyces sp. SID3343 TaxID=2690260 RepID=UPI0013C27985
PRAATGEAALRGGLAAHALAVTTTALSCVRHGLGPITGWDVEVEHRLERRRLTADATVRFDTGGRIGVRVVELDRATMPLQRLAAKIELWTRWAEHRIHEGPRHLIGSSRAVWRDHYPGPDCPGLWVVLTGADPAALRRRIDRLRPELHAMRVLDRRAMGVHATTLDVLAEHGPAGASTWTRIV